MFVAVHFAIVIRALLIMVTEVGSKTTADHPGDPQDPLSPTANSPFYGISMYTFLTIWVIVELFEMK